MIIRRIASDRNAETKQWVGLVSVGVSYSSTEGWNAKLYERINLERERLKRDVCFFAILIRKDVFFDSKRIQIPS